MVEYDLSSSCFFSIAPVMELLRLQQKKNRSQSQVTADQPSLEDGVKYAERALNLAHVTLMLL